MKMFLTRLGFNTTMVITGDITQIDLTVPRSGLATIEGILGGLDDIAFVHLDARDVVRHELVGRIVEAYDRHAKVGKGGKSGRSSSRERSMTKQDVDEHSVDEPSIKEQR
jgi:phosphate starvation-inducible PhoH-like protein